MTARLRLVPDSGPKITERRRVETVYFTVTDAPRLDYTDVSGMPASMNPTRFTVEFTNGVFTSVKVRGIALRADGTEIPWIGPSFTYDVELLPALPLWIFDLLDERGWLTT